MSKIDTIKAIEDFLIVKSNKIEKSSLLLIFGGTDLKLSDHAANLYKNGYCKYILISGGTNKFLINSTEAQWHKDNLVKKGVPINKILLEKKASNSLENVLFSKKLIQAHFRKIPDRIIIVCKAFHGRRILMTLRKNFSKNTKYILQLVQTKNHKVLSWYKQKNIRGHVLDEIRKIGDYALKGDITYK